MINTKVMNKQGHLKILQNLLYLPNNEIVFARVKNAKKTLGIM